MERKLSPDEKRLIEREFDARQEVSAKRRTMAFWVFIVGILAGVGSMGLREFHVRTMLSPLLAILWVACLLAYLGGSFLPGTFTKDVDLRWHSNPWQETLENLSQGRTQVEAIALLAGPFLARVLFSFLYIGFK